MQYEDTLYTRTAAAKLAGVHPETISKYVAMGVVVPKRASDGTRIYTPGDIAAIRARADAWRNRRGPREDRQDD